MTTQEHEGPPQGPLSGLRLKVELWVVVILMGVAFTAGVLARGSGSKPATDLNTTFGQSGVVAPPLDDQQIQGGLPQGHPPIDQGAQPSSPAKTSPKASASP